MERHLASPPSNCLGVLLDRAYGNEYVEANRLMLQQLELADHVLATGGLGCVRQFCEVGFRFVGFVWNRSLGNASRAAGALLRGTVLS